jgi:hypothetical protein
MFELHFFCTISLPYEDRIGDKDKGGLLIVNRSSFHLEINSRPILIIISSRKAERYVVYSSNFEITF